MLAHRNNITQYIPQRFPIVMIHDLVEASDTHAVTNLSIEPDNVFVSNGFFAEPGLVENIAQTAAVHIGYQCASKNIPIPIGYIAAIRSLKIKNLAPVGKTVKTTIRITNKVLELTVVEGKVELDGEELCSCEMRIFAKLES
jgi:predicted hotdog family 3-hydroxylacyl-ACP dehydratase